MEKTLKEKESNSSYINTTDKGNEFKGVAAGKSYVKWAKFFGFTEKFYRKAIGDINIKEPLLAVDLGCGPGLLSFSLANRLSKESKVIGLDISEEQLAYAREEAQHYACKMEFLCSSMDELYFENNSVDYVISSMAFHEATAAVRRKAIAETARILKPGGEFILVDWSKPKFGFWGIVWYKKMSSNQNARDNWNNTYPQICNEVGLEQLSDSFINSMARRQVFRKKEL